MEEIEIRYKEANILLIIIYISCFYFSIFSFDCFLLYLSFVQIMFLMNNSSLFFDKSEDIDYLNDEFDILRLKNFANIYYNKSGKVVYELYDGSIFESSLFNEIIISPDYNYNKLDLENKRIEIVNWDEKWRKERGYN